MLDDYSSYNHVPLDHDKQENNSLTSAFGEFAYHHMLFGSCNAPALESLAEDNKLSACRRQPFITLSLLLSFDLVLLVFFFCFCCVFQDMCLPFKFRGAFSYITSITP